MTGAFGPVLFGLLAAAQVPEPLPADDVTWSAPADCPDRDALLVAIAARRSRPLEPGQARIVGRTTRAAPRRYRLELELDVRGRSDHRVLVAHTCGALVDAAALVIALAVDGDAGTVVIPLEPAPKPGEDEPTPAPPTVAEPYGEAATAAPPPPERLESAPIPTPPNHGAEASGSRTSPPPVASTAPAPRRHPGGFLRLQGLGEAGALPALSGGLGLAGGLLWRWFRLELTATWVAPRAMERHQVRFRTGLFAVAALGCVRLGDRRVVELPICLGLEAGGLPGVADTASGRVTALGRWFAGTLSVGAAVRLHPRVALWAALQGLVAFQRGTFVLRDPGPELSLFDPEVGSGRLALGIELRFGERQ